MADFSIGGALGAGFRLIGRKPLAVLAWGVTYFVLIQLINIIWWFTVGDQAFHAMGDNMAWTTAHPGAAPDLSKMMATQAQMSILWPLQMLSFILTYAILNAAVYRAVLEPKNEGFFYLRLGGQELWQGLLVICQFVCSFAVIILVVIACVVAGIVSVNLMDRTSAGWVVLAIVLIGIGLVLWLYARFSMAGPLSFAERTFRLFESWSFTAGHALKLFGLGLLLAIVIFAIGLVIEVALVSLALGGMGAAGFNPMTWVNDPQAMSRLMPYFIIGGGVMSLFAGAFHAIMLAPWAEAYRQLSGRAAAERALV